MQEVFFFIIFPSSVQQFLLMKHQYGCNECNSSTTDFFKTAALCLCKTCQISEI